MILFSFLYKKITWVLNSFSIKDNGASRRALSAFFGIVLMAGWVTVRFTSTANAPTVITIWLVFSSLCLGMITAEQIIKFKNGGGGEPDK